MKLNEWVKAARQHAKLSQEKLGEALGRTKANISSMENGRHEPSIEQLLKISKLCGYPLPQEIGGGANTTAANIDSRRIPLLTAADANMAFTSDAPSLDAFKEHVTTDMDVGPLTFAMVIAGDEMLPHFRAGDRIIIDPDVDPLPGDFVVAQTRGSEAIFRKYQLRPASEEKGHEYDLAPLNTDYPTLNSKAFYLDILGTMVEHRQYRRR